jgi:hypothetical protein
MEERRNIIIPTGSDAEETLSTPHFDTEATLTARPVVPLSEPPAPDEDVYAYTAAPASAVGPRAGASPWKRSTLVLIILAAVSLGVASGLAIGLYQTRRKAPATAAPVAAQPPLSEPQAATAQPAPTLTPRIEQQPQEAAQGPLQEVEPETEAQPPAAPPVKETKSRTDEKVSSTDERDRNDRQAARDNSKRVEADNARREDARRFPPRVERDDRADDSAGDYEREERRGRRERRREERRADRRRQREDNGDEAVGLPRPAERARQEINRIRDIFEGRQP